MTESEQSARPRSNWINENGNGTAKWRGHSLNKMRDALKSASEAQRAKWAVEQALDVQIKNETDKVKAIVGPLVGVSPSDLHIGSWDCVESPTRHCLYDNSKDSMHDSCVICGDPAERK